MLEIALSGVHRAMWGRWAQRHSLYLQRGTARISDRFCS